MALREAGETYRARCAEYDQATEELRRVCREARAAGIPVSEHYRALTDVPYVHRPLRFTDAPGSTIPYKSEPTPSAQPRAATHYDYTPAIAASTAAIIACS
jgi:hypothetical protein